MKKIVVAIIVLFTAFTLSSWTTVSPKKVDSSRPMKHVDFNVHFSGYDYGNSITLFDDKGKQAGRVNSSQGLDHTLKLKPGIYNLQWDLVPYEETSCSISLSGNTDMLYSIREAESHVTFPILIGDGLGENTEINFGSGCRR